jgi:hypothetical protein
MPPLTSDLPELAQARTLWARHDLYGALAAFQRAVKASPQHPRALLEAANALGELYQFAPAEALLQRLVALAADEGPLLLAAGRVYQHLRRTRQAEACFRAALAARHSAVEARHALAELLERQNRLHEASNQLSALIAELPGHVAGRLLFARVQRRQGETEAAERALHALLKHPAATARLSASAWLELAALHDGLGRYAEAWQAMLKGKELAAGGAETARAHRDRLAPALWQLARDVTPSHLARWRAAAQQTEETPRVALLTGLPRSGTTLLERALNAHPALVGCDEYNVFPRFVYPAILGGRSPEAIDVPHLDSLSEARLPEQRRRYVHCLASAVSATSGAELLLDKNPSLLPLLVPYLRLSPDARVLVALRDPRDVLLSCLLADMPLNDFAVDFLDPQAGAARVAADLECWLALRPKVRENCLEVRYEDTVADLPTVAKQAIEHLGLPWSDDVLRYRELGEGQVVHSPSYDSVGQPLHGRAIGRWRNYAPFMAPLLPTLDGVVRSLGYAGE